MTSGAGARGDDVVTGGAPTLPLPAHADAPAPGTEPNGWFVGPVDDPDRYELLGTGVSGGEGVTWRARYRGGLHAPVPLAIKVLRREVGAPQEWPSADDRARWRDQTVLMRHLHLDHLVQLHDVVVVRPPHRRHGVDLTAPETAAIEMEWVEGPTLGAVARGVAATRATLAERVGFVADVCTALAQLHSHTRTAGNPTVHRDVTPANGIVTADRGVVLVDLSTMQMSRDGMDAAGRHTPAYSAPEVLAEPHRPRQTSADVYSAGALAFFCLTGEDPPISTARDAVDQMRQQLRGLARRLGLDPRLSDHVLLLLGADPDRRPTDLRRWSSHLTQLARPRWAPVGGRRSRLAALVVVGLVLVGLLAGGAPDRVAGGSSTEATAPSTGPVVIVPTGQIISPMTGVVHDCDYFAGTASVPTGMTLVLSAVDVTSGNPMHYIQDVFGYSDPARLTRWRVGFFFNQSLTGQDLRMDLIAVDLKAAERAEAADDYDTNDALARSGTVLSSEAVVRASGKDGVHTCLPPKGS